MSSQIQELSTIGNKTQPHSHTISVMNIQNCQSLRKYTSSTSVQLMEAQLLLITMQANGGRYIGETTLTQRWEKTLPQYMRQPKI